MFIFTRCVYNKHLVLSDSSGTVRCLACLHLEKMYFLEIYALEGLISSWDVRKCSVSCWNDGYYFRILVETLCLVDCLYKIISNQQDIKACLWILNWWREGGISQFYFSSPFSIYGFWHKYMTNLQSLERFESNNKVVKLLVIDIFN